MQKGFTLIELLIVIAILGVLAAAVLVMINPIEQLARGRDSGRKSTIGQLTSAMQAYYTTQNGTYITVPSTTWMTSLVTAGELKNEPSTVTYSIAGHSNCTTNQQNGYCYNTNNTEAIIYTRLESSSEETKCTSAQDAFFLWSSQDAQAGVVCVTAGQQPSAYSGYTYK